jgi:hypothetical protein
MSAVSPANSTLSFIRTKVRRLTASSGESVLTTNSIDEYINNFYLNDFPYAIKIDQMRAVYTFFTRPYIDRYPLDVNFNMGIRGPVYFEGIIGSLFKDRGQFYNLWPKFPTKFQQGGSGETGTITGVAQPTNPTQITSVAHNLITGAVITITGVVGMTQLNGNTYTITVIDANTFSLNGIDNTAFGAYVSGGTWTSTNQSFSFLIPGPFLSREVVIGGVDAFGNAISINDNGSGILQLLTSNPVVSVPNQNQAPTAPIPGMLNLNTGNPGLISPLNIGTVDYVSGQIAFQLPSGISLGSGQLFTVWVSQYQTGRPYCILFWNNELTIRPVPKLIHKVELETYLTPVQFMEINDVPILNQWAQYIAYGAAMEILRDRQDMEGVENLREGMMRQEALVLERQGVEEINTPNYTLFNSSQINWMNGGFGQGWWP